MQKPAPQHVAIIMDGNGRWANRRKHSRIFGHVRGASRVKSIVKAAKKSGVHVLTLYAFSTENWTRPLAEREVLWRLLGKFLRQEVDELDREGVRLNVLGDVTRLDDGLQKLIQRTCERLSKNSVLVLNLAISYGGREELLIAAKRMAIETIEGKLDLSSVTEKNFTQYLSTAELDRFSDVDLLIRTSGEKRISNFLLWQSAYAELVFTDVCWPDFRDQDFFDAVSEFQKRDRRFGGTVSERSAGGEH